MFDIQELLRRLQMGFPGMNPQMPIHLGAPGFGGIPGYGHGKPAMPQPMPFGGVQMPQPMMPMQRPMGLGFGGIQNPLMRKGMGQIRPY